MRKNVTKRYYIIICGLFLVLINSCNGQHASDSCISQIKNARAAFSYYLMNDDTSQSKLITILSEVDSSMQCSNTKMASIELKISILLKLKEYQAGYAFVDSLKQADFKLPYKKQMWSYCFQALDYEAKGDTINKNRYFNEAAKKIQNYIRQKNLSPEGIGEEVYYDLFEMKVKILNKEELDKEFNILKNKYPNDKDFIDELSSSIEENGEKSIEANP